MTNTCYGQISYQYSDDLPSTNLYHSLVDNNNLLWLACDNGLFSYNGFEFESVEMRNNDILAIRMDSYGRIWGVNSSGGLFYIQNRKVYNHSNTQWIPERLTSIVVDCKLYGNAMYISHGSCVDVVIKDTIFRLNNRLGDIDNIRHLWMMQNRVFVQTSRRIYELANGNYIPIPSWGNSEEIKDVLKFQDDEILLTDNFIYKFSLNQGNAQISKLCRANLNASDRSMRLFKAKGKVFLYSQRQLYVVNFENKALEAFFKTPPMITSISEDEHHNLWLTSLGGGLIQLPDRFMSFRKIKDFEQFQGDVAAFYVDHQVTLFQTRGTIVQNERTIRFSKHDQNNIRGIAAIKKGYLIGTDVGLYYLNERSHGLTYFGKVAVKQVQVINGFVYHANHSTLLRHPLANVINNRDLTGERLWRGRVYSFACDDNEVIWASTLKGFYKIEGSKQSQYFVENASVQAACLNVINYDKTHLIIIASDNHVYLADKRDGSLTTIYDFSKNIRINQSLLKDGQIWFATNKGIMRLDLTPNLHYAFDIGFKVIFDHRLYNADIKYMQIEGDTLYFSNMYGLYAFDFKKYKSFFSYSPRLYSATSSNQPLELTNHFVLDHQYRNLTLSWTDPGYSGMQFYYRVNTDKRAQWQKMAKNVFDIPDLRNGNYTIDIATTDVFTSPIVGATVKLSVTGRLIEYKWFQILLGSVGMGLIALIVLYWQSFRNRENILKQELIYSESNLKLSSLQSQMNPHFLRNSLNSIHALIHSNQKNRATTYISHFSDLIEEFIKFSGVNFISLEKELKMINHFVKLEQLRFEGEFKFDLSMDETVPLHLEIPSMFLQPIVENAIEHGLLPSKNSAKSLKIEILYDLNVLTINVIDNGIGFKQATEETDSIALKNIQKRIHTINAFDDIKIRFHIFDNSETTSTRAMGTTASIHIQYFS